ncbi:MAG TPA: hypothetical protein EYP98_18700, partial [Planctomycetes bacterium]|nr:hypothetical protein [Planctomycetota bacterium]
IDIKDGLCVRLLRGDMNAATVFNDDPADQARAFRDVGFKWLHLVDLNGAFEGRPVNADAVASILAAIDIPVQLGGGIRDIETIDRWLDAGVRRVILGTVALTEPELVFDACRRHPGRIVVGIDAPTSAAAKELCRLPGVRWSAGLHPNDSTKFDDQWPTIDALARESTCVAIGETGLDCFRDRTPLDQQERSLRAHLALARELDKPVIFHCRDAFEPLFRVLESEQRVRGVMHCFSGGIPEADKALALGLYLSFAGPLTYPKNQVLRDACAHAPANRVLVETDAPFLPPQSRRGRRNEPALVIETLTKLAEVRNLSLEDAAALTYANAMTLFG